MAYLPAKNGLGQYQGTNRIIVNSACITGHREYVKRFPNEMKVYYEDDELSAIILRMSII